MIAKIGGHAPESCPWRTLKEPLVMDTVDLWSAAHAGDHAHLASVYRASLPAHLWEALKHFDACARAVLAHARERAEAQQKRRR